MVIKKRQVLWDWSNSAGPGNPGVPDKMNQINFDGNHPVASVVNWNAWVPPELAGRAPFRPMVRVLESTTGTDWATIQNTDAPIILFFNEPDRAGISPEQARDIWLGQMVPLRTTKGKQLGSPAVASDANGQQWIEKFMSLVPNDMPDFLCLHYYSKTADEATKYIESMHQKWANLKVMVTEIACIDRDYHVVLDFTVKVCNWLDSQDWVFEYGLFDFQRNVADGFVSPAAQLMDANGNFTELGNMYINEQPMNAPGAVAVANVATNGIKVTNGAATTNGFHAMTGFTVAAAATAALTADQKKALDAHNSKRKEKGVPPLAWDAAIAKSAQDWAKHMAQTGKFEHSSGDQRPNQGENIAWVSSSGDEPLSSATSMWLGEEKNYHGEPIGQGDFANYGHYTQCLWKSTTKVGIASATDAKGAVYTVGRYSPPGNFGGQKPY
ncbi:glycoside hydrolase family 128 protein [Xylaria nigripes]|nr:glycoside hydrolase family 128 protein [Xylaria nigripes]